MRKGVSENVSLRLMSLASLEPLVVAFCSLFIKL